MQDHAGRRFDDTHLALHAGPRWLADPRTELSVLANASRRWLGGSVEHDAAGARIEAHRRLTDRVWASVHASWLDHDYRDGTGRDGPVVDLLLSGTWRIRPTVDRFSPAIGYSEQRTHSRPVQQPEPAAAGRHQRRPAPGLLHGRQRADPLDGLP